MKIESQDDIIKLIKHYMIDYNIKQKDIVEKSGLQKSTVSNLLAGRSNMQINTLLALLDYADAELIVEIKPKNDNDNENKNDNSKE